MRTVLIVMIAILCFFGIIGTVFIIGGMYQQELFEDYMENSKKPPKRSLDPTDIPLLVSHKLK